MSALNGTPMCIVIVALLQHEETFSRTYSVSLNVKIKFCVFEQCLVFIKMDLPMCPAE